MSIDNLSDDVKKYLCHLKILINGKERDFYVNEDLSISYDDIEFELDKLPQIFQLWAMIYSEVKEQVNILDKKIKRRRGMLYNEISNNEGKSLRRSDINDIVECDDDLLKLDAQYIRLQKLAGKLYFTIEALKMKNDNIRSLCGFKKQEIRNS